MAGKTRGATRSITNEGEAPGAAFACSIYAKLAGEKGNAFLSPYSISSALSLALAGARGRTAEQIAKSLGVQGGPEAHASAGALRAALDASGGPVVLAVANALFPQAGFGLRPDFVKTTRESYGAELREMDYRKDAESCRAEINRWVEDATRDKIKDLLPPQSVDAATRLVLANAIYFKGPWESPFEESRTDDGTFWADGKRGATVPMMHQRLGPHDARYAEGKGCQVLDLPYDGRQLSMTIVLPKERAGLPLLERLLTPKLLGQWTSALAFRPVILSLPRFKVESSYDLAGALKALGMADLFDEKKADLSGIAGKKGDLVVSGAFHKAYVDVTEEGTEAAAATGLVAIATSVMRPVPPVEFTADHPFLYLIRHRPTGAVLFIGRLSDPAGAKANPRSNKRSPHFRNG